MCTHRRAGVEVRECGAGFQMDPLKEKEAILTAKPFQPHDLGVLFCWFSGQYWLDS